jgi:RNA polymerase sigma factor (TIGR02999 family)
MSEPERHEVTQLLLAWRGGDAGAFERLVPMVYQDLRRLARNQLRRDHQGWTLETTGLVHEAWLRLVDADRVDWQDRGHFLGVAARAMRQVVIEYARRRSAEKRGGGVRAATLDEQVIPIDEHAEWLLDLNEALERLAAHRVRLARVVECRFFAGLSNEETAEALGSSVRTVKRDWTFARSWLQRELGGTAAGR